MSVRSERAQRVSPAVANERRATVTDTTAATESTWRTMRRGLALSPELRTGLGGTIALALVAMVGRAVVPVAIQQGIDREELRPHDTQAIATLLTAQFEGLALLWLLDPETIDRAYVHEQGLRATFDGLRA